MQNKLMKQKKPLQKVRYIFTVCSFFPVQVTDINFFQRRIFLNNEEKEAYSRKSGF